MQEQETQVKIVMPYTGLMRWLANNLITFKATAENTHGIYSLFEISTPSRDGMLPHLHWYEDETFWVLEGTYRFLFDMEALDLGVGGYIFVPRGILHSFTNNGRSTARMLSFVTPGGIHERFFAEAGKPAVESGGLLTPPDPSDLARIIKIARKYGIEMHQPPNAS
jgi:mannose-6-phosphate isomerase-like protein (cupin superfamily)